MLNAFVLNLTLLLVSGVRYFITAQLIARQPFSNNLDMPNSRSDFSQSINDNITIINVLTLKIGKGSALKTSLPLYFVPVPRKSM